MLTVNRKNFMSNICGGRPIHVVVEGYRPFCWASEKAGHISKASPGKAGSTGGERMKRKEKKARIQKKKNNLVEVELRRQWTKPNPILSLLPQPKKKIWELYVNELSPDRTPLPPTSEHSSYQHSSSQNTSPRNTCEQPPLIKPLLDSTHQHRAPTTSPPKKERKKDIP